MNTFATGTTGTIGKHLATKVIPISIDLTKKFEEYSSISLTNRSTVIHLASVVGDSLVQNNIAYSEAVNIEGTEKLARACQLANVSKFVFASTGHVYEQSFKPVTENSQISPINIYGKQKFEAENRIRKVFEDNPKKLCIVRIFSVLDWDVSPRSLGGAIKRLIEPNSDFEIKNGGDIRDFLTPKTIAEAILQISNNVDVYGVVNLCSGQALSVKAAALLMLKKSKIQIDERRIISEVSQVPYLVGENSKLSKLIPHLSLTWNPSYISRY